MKKGKTFLNALRNGSISDYDEKDDYLTKKSNKKRKILEEKEIVRKKK